MAGGVYEHSSTRRRAGRAERVCGVTDTSERPPHPRSPPRRGQTRDRTTCSPGPAPTGGPSGSSGDDRRVLDRLRGSRGVGRRSVPVARVLLHVADPPACPPRPGGADDRRPRPGDRFGATRAVDDRRAVPRGAAPVHRGRIRPLPGHRDRRRRRGASRRAFGVIHAASPRRSLVDLVLRRAEPSPVPPGSAREDPQGRRRARSGLHRNVLHPGDRERRTARPIARSDARRFAPHRRRQPREGRDLDPRDPEGLLRPIPASEPGRSTRRSSMDRT